MHYILYKFNIESYNISLEYGLLVLLVRFVSVIVRKNPANQISKLIG
jgi:hypothetical protein